MKVKIFFSLQLGNALKSQKQDGTCVSTSLHSNSDHRGLMSALQDPDRGLELKDQVWMKIHLGKGFLGKNLVRVHNKLNNIE